MHTIDSILKIIDKNQPCSLSVICEEAGMDRKSARTLVVELEDRSCIKKYANGQYVVTSTGKIRIEVNDPEPEAIESKNGKTDVEKENQDDLSVNDFGFKPPRPVKLESVGQWSNRPTIWFPEELETLSTDELLELCKKAEKAREIVTQRVQEAGLI